MKLRERPPYVPNPITHIRARCRGGGRGKPRVELASQPPHRDIARFQGSTTSICILEMVCGRMAAAVGAGALRASCMGCLGLGPARPPRDPSSRTGMDRGGVAAQHCPHDRFCNVSSPVALHLEKTGRRPALRSAGANGDGTRFRLRQPALGQRCLCADQRGDDLDAL